MGQASTQGCCICSGSRPELDVEVVQDFAGDGKEILIPDSRIHALAVARGNCPSPGLGSCFLEQGLLAERDPVPSQSGVLAAVSKKAQEGQQIVDPRRTLGRFFRDGDSVGPRGCLVDYSPKRHSILASTPVAEKAIGKHSSWFAVFRPCSDDAIQKMVFGQGRGKGLNVKGKSAKQGPLSGFVPFLQISDNDHKKKLSTPSRSSRLQIYYKTQDARDRALEELTQCRNEMVEALTKAQNQLDDFGAGLIKMTDDEEREAFEAQLFQMDDPSIGYVDDYAEHENWGLEMPERLIRQALINKPDLTFKPGCETGRNSSPAFCDMNFSCLRDSNRGQNTQIHHTTILQCDSKEPMDPHSLVIAYAGERGVHPVVSDFDCFMIGSTGVHFAPLSQEQQTLCTWCIRHTELILDNPSTSGWSSRWLDVLKSESEKGFHPEIPKFGFGDPTSYKIVEKLAASMKDTGGVRHGAECFNFYFPQELDEEYLIIWGGYGEEEPWSYASEPDTRQFLFDRIAEGYSFPISPAWAVRDIGWYSVLQALRSQSDTCAAISQWYPPDSGILQSIDRIHKKHPNGFEVQKGTGERGIENATDALSAEESADLAMQELKRAQMLKRAKSKLKSILMMQKLLNASRAKNSMLTNAELVK